MPGRVRVAIVTFAVVASALTVGAVGVPAATASTTTQDRIVSSVPASWTPRVNDGSVQTITQVGNQVVLGGNFTSVSASSGSPTYTRQRIVAFDAATGAINTAFAPTINGTVNKVVAGPLPNTVLVGGSFSQVNGQSRRLVLLNLSNGAVVPSFTAAVTNGQIRDMKAVGNRLYVGGLFTTAGGQPHRGLMAVNFTTGALDPFVNNQFTVNHNWTPGCTNCAKAGIGVSYLDVSADGSTLIATGNFKNVDGFTRDQIVNLDLTGASAAVRADWNTDRYTPACASRAFDTYMRGLAMSPDGSYFVVVATGAPFAGTLCDAAARFETAGRGSAVEPTWVDYSGGDTFLSVEITGSAVYTGGHMRWMNNDNGRDSAGTGAVPRPGLNALDPASGVPLSWNPGRNPRGVGASAIHATSAGLWVGSDTDWIGNRTYRRPKIAFFPLAGGTVPPAGVTSPLPADVYYGGPLAQPGLDPTGIYRRFYDGASASAASQAPAGGMDWSAVRGAVLIDDMLYYGHSTDDRLHRRTFDGTTYGPDTAVDPYNDPYWCPVGTGSGTTVYCGVVPSFYGQLDDVNAMAYAHGRLYYTLDGQNGLLYRTFSPESGIVGANAVTVPGTTAISGARALLVSGGNLYYASPANGNLSRIAFGPTGVSGNATVVSGPGVDGVDWRARAVFLAPDAGTPTNQSPQSSFTSSCTGLTCTFDGSASDDPDGAIVSHTWDFGDGTNVTAAGAPGSIVHPYSAGTYLVTLTVVDDDDATASSSATVKPAAIAAPVAAFSSGCTQLDCSFDGSASSTGAGPLTYAWTFGDGDSGTGVSPTHTYDGADTYTVTLTITDALSRQDSVSQDVTVSTVPAGDITFVAAAGANANVNQARVTVPGATQAGDALVMTLTMNNTTATPSTPTGWTLVDEASTSGLVSRVYRRTATGADAGSVVTVPYTGGYAKTAVDVVVYRGVAGGDFLDATAQTYGSGSDRATPAVQVTTAGSWVLSYWSDKSSGTTTAWTVPGSTTLRRESYGTGGGAVSAALADSGGGVAAGTYPARTASSNASASRALAWTLVLAPA